MFFMHQELFVYLDNTFVNYFLEFICGIYWLTKIARDEIVSKTYKEKEEITTKRRK